MLFAIDIDGTIACDNHAQFLKICNQHFSLGLTDERLDSLNWPASLALPEVVVCREERGARRFDAALRLSSQNAPSG